MLQGLQGSLAFFEAARLGHGFAPEVRLQVTSDLFRDAGDVGGDLMGGPAFACTDRIRRSAVNSGQEGVRLDAAFDRHVRSPFGEIDVPIPDSRHGHSQGPYGAILRRITSTVLSGL